MNERFSLSSRVINRTEAYLPSIVIVIHPSSLIVSLHHHTLFIYFPSKPFVYHQIFLETVNKN